MSNHIAEISKRLITITESVLTWRLRRKESKKAKQAKKHFIVDWLEAFLWAAAVVLLINQYGLQAYQIPSPSMVKTLIEGDRIFVDKFSYGPELLPTIAKIPGISAPKRGDVICFENPEYESNGPVFLVFQRIIYMVTLAMVDIDRDQAGDQKKYLLIKRAIAVGGDRVRFRDGDFEIKAPGEAWMSEQSFKKLSGLGYRTERKISNENYKELAIFARSSIHAEAGVRLSASEQRYYDYFHDSLMDNPDKQVMLETKRESYLMEPRLQQDSLLAEVMTGFYVAPDSVLPLGDNRDNSKDGRYFGPVPINKVTGKALFIFWPVDRIGLIR